MKKSFKNCISMLLVLVLVFSNAPAVLADEVGESSEFELTPNGQSFFEDFNSYESGTNGTSGTGWTAVAGASTTLSIEGGAWSHNVNKAGGNRESSFTVTDAVGGEAVLLEFDWSVGDMIGINNRGVLNILDGGKTSMLSLYLNQIGNLYYSTSTDNGATGGVDTGIARNTPIKVSTLFNFKMGTISLKLGDSYTAEIDMREVPAEANRTVSGFKFNTVRSNDAFWVFTIDNLRLIGYGVEIPAGSSLTPNGQSFFEDFNSYESGTNGTSGTGWTAVAGASTTLSIESGVWSHNVNKAGGNRESSFTVTDAVGGEAVLLEFDWSVGDMIGINNRGVLNILDGGKTSMLSLYLNQIGNLYYSTSTDNGATGGVDTGIARNTPIKVSALFNFKMGTISLKLGDSYTAEIDMREVPAEANRVVSGFKFNTVRSNDAFWVFTIDNLSLIGYNVQGSEKIYAQSVQLSPDSAALKSGPDSFASDRTVTFSADVRPVTLEDRSVVWSTEDTNKIQLVNNADGTVTVTAIAEESTTATLTATANTKGENGEDISSDVTIDIEYVYTPDKIVHKNIKFNFTSYNLSVTNKDGSTVTPKTGDEVDGWVVVLGNAQGGTYTTGSTQLNSMYTTERGWGFIANVNLGDGRPGETGNTYKGIENIPLSVSKYTELWNSSIPFVVNVPNGLYTVKGVFSNVDDKSSARSIIFNNGIQISGSTAASAIEVVSQTVNVTDGQLTMTFGAQNRVAGIIIEQLLETPEISSISNVIPKEGKFDVTIAPYNFPEGASVTYNIYTQTSNRPEELSLTVNAVGTYTAAVMRGNAVYNVTVEAIVDGVTSARSTPVTATLYDESLTPPDTVTQVTITPENGKFTLEWEKVTGADSYIIYRSFFENGVYQKIATVEDIDTYVDTHPNLTNIAKTYYRFESMGEGGISELSEKFASEITGSGYVPSDNGTGKDRGLVAINLAGTKGAEVLVSATDTNGNEYTSGVYLSWRWYEADTDNKTTFDIYRDGVQIASNLKVTNLVDEGGTAYNVYKVVGSSDNEQGLVAKEVRVWWNYYLELQLYQPAAQIMPDGTTCTYTANDSSIGSLGIDGDYDLLVVKWDPSNAQDNSNGGYTGTQIMDGYQVNWNTGEIMLLWRIDLGVNIRSGAHYTQFIVWDFNEDGCAEIMMKTADGSTTYRSQDGTDQTLVETGHVGAVSASQLPTNVLSGRASYDYRNCGDAPYATTVGNGYILAGPEYVSCFNGSTGEIMDTIDCYFPRGEYSWGDLYGNRMDRFNAAVAYLEGTDEHPSYLLQRGYYTRMTLTEYYLDDNNKLQVGNTYDSAAGSTNWENIKGQGNHSIAINDITGDGKDDIIFGALVLKNDFTVLEYTNFGHGNAMHVGNFIYTDGRENKLEIMMIQENDNETYHVHVRDALTGELLAGYYVGREVGRGMIARIDPTVKNAQFWANCAPVSEIRDDWFARAGVFSLESEFPALLGKTEDTTVGELTQLAEGSPSINFDLYWSGDLLSEFQDHTYNNKPISTNITKWDYLNNKEIKLFESTEVYTNNGTKGNPCLKADILGDWREELLLRCAFDNSKVRLYRTTIQTDYVIPHLMENLAYHEGTAWQNSSYNQPQHIDYMPSANALTAREVTAELIDGSVEVSYTPANDGDYGFVVTGHQLWRRDGDANIGGIDFRSKGTLSNTTRLALTAAGYSVVAEVTGSDNLTDTEVLDDTQYSYIVIGVSEDGKLSYIGDPLTITTVSEQTPVTIEGISVDDKEYDGTPVEPVGELVIMSGETKVTAEYTDLVYTYTSTDDGDYESVEAPHEAGDYELLISTAANSQYVGSSAPIIFTISKKDATVRVRDEVIVAGSEIPGFVLEYEGLVDGDEFVPDTEPTFEYEEVDISTEGEYTITWTNSDEVDFGDVAARNYNINKVTTGILTIENSPDKSDLEALIEEVEALIEGDYTAESWSVLQLALESAICAIEDDLATKADVNAAYENLQTAISELVEIGKVPDKEELNALIAQVQAMNAEDYTQESWEQLLPIYNTAVDVSGNADAAELEVTTATSNLRNAITALVLASDEPTEPIGPTDPTDPTDPTNPTEPTEPTEPTDPTDPTDPTNPTEPTEPTEPIEPIKPIGPTEPTTQISSSGSKVSIIEINNYGSVPEAAKFWGIVNTDIGNTVTTSTESFNYTVFTGRNIVVPTFILNTLQNSSGTLAMHTGVGVTFSITGSNIPDTVDTGTTVNLTIRQGELTAPAALIQEKTWGTIYSREIPMESHESFGMTVNMHFSLGADNADKYANLYRYNELTGRFEYLGSYQINEDGQAMFGIIGGADFLLTVTTVEPDEVIVPMGGENYTVRTGDTLSGIASRYGMSLAQIVALNPEITNISRIRPGQKVRVR